jgi:hypothetical protein
VGEAAAGGIRCRHGVLGQLDNAYMVGASIAGHGSGCRDPCQRRGGGGTRGGAWVALAGAQRRGNADE